MSANPQSNRRQFLTGQAAVDAVSHFAPDVPASLPAGPHAAKDAGYLIQVDRVAMACGFQILLNADESPSATEAALDAMDLVERLEEQLSWFRDTSELTRINRTATASSVVVERRLFGLLLNAISLSEETSGAFDITAAPLWELWGFHRREGKLPTDADIRKTLERTGPDKIVLDADKQSIQFTRDGVEINLGAIGKGYALDRCAETLALAGVDDFVIHGGQSSMLAQGSKAGDAGWTVALRHPLRQEQRLAEITLRDRALGTSGSGNQFFHHGGRRYGHILDPRTGHPADTLLSATALAPSAAQADALATAFFVMGADASTEFCHSHPEIGAILVLAGEQSGATEIISAGIEDADWELVD